MHMLFVVLLRMLEASSNFHKHCPRRTKLLAFLYLELALSFLSQVLALSQILHLLEYLPLDTASDPVSSSLEDTMLDQSEYVPLGLYTTKTRRFGYSQYVQLFHYIVVVPQQTCYLS